MVALAIAGATAASAIGAVGSGIIGSNASKSAASAQAAAAEKAAAQQMAMFEQTRGDLTPFREAGENVLGTLGDYPGVSLNLLRNAYDETKSHIPGDMTIESLEKTPFYKFSRDQGLKALQSSAASRGLGISGTSMQKGMEYATGLAQKNYTDAFSIQQTQYKDYLDQLNALTGITKQGYDMYQGIANMGATAAARSGALGTEAAKASGEQTAAAGQAQAAGIAGAGNALKNTVSSLGNLGFSALAYNKLLSGGVSEGSAGPALASAVTKAYGDQQYN